MQILDRPRQLADLVLKLAAQTRCRSHGLAQLGFQLIDTRARLGLLADQFVLEFDHAAYALAELRFQHIDVPLALAQHVGGTRHVSERRYRGLTGVAANGQKKMGVMRVRAGFFEV